MMQVRIKDGSFFQANSATLAGDNTGLGPKYFEWRRDDTPAPVTFFTDICLAAAIEDTSQKKVAWLIEPPEVNPNSYQFCLDHEGLFDYVLTHSRAHLDNKGWLFYPFGGSWIAADKWKIWDKTKTCSIIVSSKRMTEGHRMRHAAVERYHKRMDVMGSGYNHIQSKLRALLPYRYSVVIENARRDWWFTEKLIDCFALGTVPIYWGCPSIGNFFNKQGMVVFSSVDELGHILKRISEDDYQRKGDAIKANFIEAQKYRCAEDWIFEHYRFLVE